MEKPDLTNCEKEYLLTLIDTLQTKLIRSNASLNTTRKKLLFARGRLRRMNEVLTRQREKILEFHS